ncbi:MAG: cation:proton antiporter, partial [Flavobacteriales bacterium]
HFVITAAIALLVGIIIGWISLKWIKGVFNDSLVENSIVVAAAYLTFYVAEHFLHVSGVLALVTLGLVVGGIGRTKISPSVQHFMHEFWEMAGFLANSLIFIIVGVVIAKRSTFHVNDFVVLGIVYVGIHLARAVSIITLYPFMYKTGYGLSVKFAAVTWFGALRGAVGLALALIVAGVDDRYIPAEIKDKFLFLTAGIVLLTLLINATGIKAFIRALGLSELPAAKVNMIINANQYLRQSAENHLQRIKSDRYMKRAVWEEVEAYLPPKAYEHTLSETELEAIAEIRRRILESEKSSYWHQFKDGLIGAEAYRHLSEGINEVMDANGMVPLSARKDFDEQWETPKLLDKLEKMPLLRKRAKKWFLGRLTVSYDCAVGFIESQRECLKLVESMYRGGEPEDVLKKMEEEINENIIHGQTFIRNLRHNYSDIFAAISTRQAIRNLIHYEHKTIERLQKKGRIDSGEAGKMLAGIEQRSKKLNNAPPEVKSK